MSIFEELTNEIFDWIDDDQNPESIKKDLIRTIEEALAEAPKRKYKAQLATLLKDYVRMAHGEEVANSLADEGYNKMTESVFNAIDDMMNEVKGYQKAVAAAANDTKRRTAPAPQEDKDAQIIADFLKQIGNKKKPAAINPIRSYSTKSDWVEFADMVDHRFNIR